jgi:hypothetical protein
MSIINIQSDHGLTRIQLLENVFTAKFIERFKRDIEIYSLVPKINLYGAYYTTDPSDVVPTQYEKLIAVIDELNAMGTNFPYTMTLEQMMKKDTGTQIILNNMHRAFTTAEKTLIRKPPHRWLTLCSARWLTSILTGQTWCMCLTSQKLATKALKTTLPILASPN